MEERVSEKSTKERLLEAAGEMFAEKGFHAASVREICERAGANVASVNYHFGDKEGLYEAVMTAIFEDLSSKHPLEVKTDGVSPEERLRQFVRTVLMRMLDEERPRWHEKLWMREHVDLCLEVLEQSLVADVEVAFEKLSALREQGVKIAIDDFGTGYSSLSYFRDIPTDELKIDQSFIRGLRQDRANVHIVSLIMNIAHRFGLQVVAEGVEDRKVAAYLKQQGCDQAQGYYFARPMPADEFANWLKSYHPDPQLLPNSSTKR